MTAFGCGLLLVTFLAFCPAAGAGDPAHDAEQAVVRFHAALASGDRGAALALLAADAIVVENGQVESRADYAAQHLAADIDFAKGVTVKHSRPGAVVEGDTAGVISVSPVKGEFKGRPVAGARGNGALGLANRTSPGYNLDYSHAPNQIRQRAVHHAVACGQGRDGSRASGSHGPARRARRGRQP